MRSIRPGTRCPRSPAGMALPAVSLVWMAAALFLAVPVDPADAATYVVRPDGTGDFATIQAAVSGVSPGDTIELTDGIYLGDGNRDIDFGGRSVTVCSQSGNPEACIIDAEGTEDETHRVFIFTSGEGPGTVVRDLTISGALVNGC